jgi:hypothetical protein
MGLETNPMAHLWVNRVFRHQFHPELAKQPFYRTAVAPPEYRVVRRPHNEDPSGGDDALCRTGKLTHLLRQYSTDE